MTPMQAIQSATRVAAELVEMSDRVGTLETVDNQIDTRDETQIFLNAQHCEVDRSGTDRAYATAFEKYRFADDIAIKDLQKALAKCDANVKPTGIFDKATRDAISATTGRRDSTVPKTDRLNDKSYEWVSGICI